MNLSRLASRTADGLRIGLASLALFQFSIGVPMVNAHEEHGSRRTPIKHVSVIIGENRSFDHVFATYQPKHGQKVWNLLSEGIVNDDGTPGPNFWKFQQYAASDTGTDPFLLSPAKSS